MFIALKAVKAHALIAAPFGHVSCVSFLFGLASVQGLISLHMPAMTDVLTCLRKSTEKKKKQQRYYAIRSLCLRIDFNFSNDGERQSSFPHAQCYSQLQACGNRKLILAYSNRFSENSK